QGSSFIVCAVVFADTRNGRKRTRRTRPRALLLLLVVVVLLLPVLVVAPLRRPPPPRLANTPSLVGVGWCRICTFHPSCFSNGGNVSPVCCVFAFLFALCGFHLHDVVFGAVVWVRFVGKVMWSWTTSPTQVREEREERERGEREKEDLFLPPLLSPLSTL